MFNFKDAKIPEGGNGGLYVQKPGFYLAKISETQLVQPEGKKPFLSVIFDTEGGKITEKFFITVDTIGRLKALFKAVWGKDLENDFGTVEEVGSYFIKALAKPKEIGVKVIAEKNGERTFHKLPYGNFVSFDLAEFKPRVVEPTDPDYNDFVVTRKVETTTSAATIIPAVEAKAPTSWNEVGKKDNLVPEDDSDDLPF